jgi:hypothetical protein
MTRCQGAVCDHDMVSIVNTPLRHRFMIILNTRLRDAIRVTGRKEKPNKTS